MPALHFTDKAVRALSTQKDFEEFWDSSFQGGSFGVRVSGTTGTKVFVLRYRKNGNRRRMTLGQYPHMSLSEARGEARSVVGRVYEGEDPARELQAYKKAETLKDLWKLFLREEADDLRPRTIEEYTRQYEKDLEPSWGDWRLPDITRGNVRLLLSHIANERDSPVSADRTRALIHRLFNFALSWDLVEANPCAGVARRAKHKKRERVLSDAEIKSLWRALEAEKEPTASLFRILLALGQRSGETRHMRWEQINDGVWEIPSYVSKNRRLHRVPLSSLSQDVLGALEPLTGYQEWVFYHSRGDGPIKWLSAATRRLREACGFHFRPHDLRRTVGTNLARMGADRLTIAKVLNHKSADNTVTGIYDRYRREPEVQEALEAWGERLEAIVGDAEEEERVLGHIA